jgi:hypothetical protein
MLTARVMSAVTHGRADRFVTNYGAGHRLTAASANDFDRVSSCANLKYAIWPKSFVIKIDDDF